MITFNVLGGLTYDVDYGFSETSYYVGIKVGKLTLNSFISSSLVTSEFGIYSFSVSTETLTSPIYVKVTFPSPLQLINTDICTFSQAGSSDIAGICSQLNKNEVLLKSE